MLYISQNSWRHVFVGLQFSISSQQQELIIHNRKLTPTS